MNRLFLPKKKKDRERHHSIKKKLEWKIQGKRKEEYNVYKNSKNKYTNMHAELQMPAQVTQVCIKICL